MILVIGISGAELAKAHLRLLPQQVARAAQQAVKRTTAAAKTLADRRIRQKVPMQAKDVRSRLKVLQSNPAVPQMKIIPSHKPVGLEYFGATPDPRGVMVDIGKGRFILLHAFFIKGHSNKPMGRMVWMRQSGAGPSGLVGRYPIERQTGPSIAELFQGILPSLITETSTILQKQFQIAIHHELQSPR
jgi:hypothetical protein